MLTLIFVSDVYNTLDLKKYFRNIENVENRSSKTGKSKLRLSVIKDKYFSNNVFRFFKGGDDFLTQLFKYDKQVVKTDIYNMRFRC